MSENPYLVRGDEWWLNPDMEIVPDPKDMEIERLRAINAKLEKVREAAEAWRADMALPVDHIRTGRVGSHLIATLDEVKA